VIGLVRADLRARWRSLAGIGVGCFVVLVALAGTYSALGGQEGFARVFGTGNFTKVFAALTGSPAANIFAPQNFVGFCFAHPMFLVLAISVAVSSGVAAVAADVESGRAEMLYTAPVSRGAVLGVRLLAWLIAQTAVIACAVGGAVLGSRLSGDLSGVSPLVPLRVAVQFWSLVFFLGAAAFAVSARARTRGTALGIGVGIAAASYTANLLALLWNPVRFLRHLNPFGYYNATAAADHVNWPDVGLLLSTGTLLLLLAHRWLEIRDLV
jgi:ABC-type transport system involved in multi-copper enzyme maturation permease subunit